MNRVILLLNVVVLVVTFFVAMSATDSQIGILRSASAAYSVNTRHRAPPPNPSMAYLRTVQALSNFASGETQNLNPEKLGAIHFAVQRYYQVIDAGVNRSLQDTGDAKELNRALELLGKEAREEVEQIIGQEFHDADVARRLTTEIIRNCR